MDHKGAINQLETAIRARVPVIGLQSAEEKRVLESVRNLLSKPFLSDDGERIVAPERLVVQWTYTQGIRVLPTTGASYVSERLTTLAEEAESFFEGEPTDEPADAMALFSKWAAGNGTAESMKAHASVLVMCDIHRFLMPSEAGGANSIETMRALRDLYQALEPTKSHALLLAPSLSHIGDSKAEIVIIDFPLPTTDELTALVRRASRTVSLPIGDTINNGGAETLAQALSGITWTQASFILRQAMVEAKELSVSACLPIISARKADILKRHQGIELVNPVPLADIGGLDLLKASVAKYPTLMNAAAKARGIKAPQGILLAGPPGTGKSWTCKVLGGGVLPILRWSPAQSKSKWVGESVENATNVLKAADAISKVVLWIDEVDLVFGGGQDSHEVSQEMLQLMLTWLQERESDAIVAMTTNHPERLPDAFRDRCDERWFVDLPRSREEALEIIDIHLRLNDIDGIDDGTKAELADKAVGGDLSPRNIAQGIVSANRNAFFDDGRLVNADDLRKEFQRRIQMSSKQADAIRQMRAEAMAWASPASSAQRAAKAQEAITGIDM